MSLNDDAPQFFSAALFGITAVGPHNVMLTFATVLPNADFSDRSFAANVRIIMPSESVKQMVEFLKEAERAQDPAATPPLPTPQKPH